MDLRYLSVIIDVHKNYEEREDKIGINWECRLLPSDDYPASLEFNILVGV